MDYSKMSDFEINKAVAEIAISGDWFLEPTDESPSWFVNLGVEGKSTVKLPDYCNNPADAWPIIMKSGINVFTDMIPHGLLGQARASITRADAVSDCIIISDKNPLRAAMIVFLMMQESANVQDNPA